MPLPPWNLEMLRQGISDAARAASQPEALAKLKSQASELLHELPDSAARGIDAMMRTAESGKQSVQRWSQRRIAISIPLMNASGVLLTPQGTGCPLAEPVSHAGQPFIEGGMLLNDFVSERIDKRISKVLPGETGRLGRHLLELFSCAQCLLAAVRTNQSCCSSESLREASRWPTASRSVWTSRPGRSRSGGR